ncbi:MAG: NF038129 family PEP-CTERM protein [Hydrogenophilales bacterium]|nr:NF038129 family PEP-CTERM protein [Hydrogenophilales bacterium]
MTKKILVTSLLALLSSHTAWADTWYVTVDTRSLSGQSGWLDFQFNPADGSAPAAAASLAAFSSDGGLAAAIPTGDVTGTLAGTLVLGNSQFFNDWLQGYTFGSTLSFSININTPVPNASGSGTAFSLSLYDSSYNSLLADPNWGASLVINANDNGAINVLAQTAPISLSTSPVPEPQSALLWLSGLGLVGWRSGKQTRVPLLRPRVSPIG